MFPVCVYYLTEKYQQAENLDLAILNINVRNLTLEIGRKTTDYFIKFKILFT